MIYCSKIVCFDQIRCLLFAFGLFHANMETAEVMKLCSYRIAWS